MPERHRAADAMFTQLLALNREAFDAGYYSTAYHALAAALHMAYAHQDAEGLARVEHLAGEQLAVIDATDPAYEYSTPSAEARGHQSIFTMLVHQAHSMLLMLPDEQDSA
jgi:hypothetical protein